MNAKRDIYTKAALVGLLLYFVAVAIFIVAFLITSPGDIAFSLFFLVPGVIVIAAVYFVRRWGLIIGVIGGLFGLLIFTENIDQFLSSPNAFFDFIGTITGVVGLIVLVLASLVGTVQYFRGDVPTETPKTWNTAMRGLAGVLAVLAVVSLVLTVLDIGGVSTDEAEGATVVMATEVKWDVEMLEARAGQPLKVLVKNDDAILHDFTIHDLDIKVKMSPWSENIVEINAPAGIYGYVCTLHVEDMTGALTIR